MPSIDRIDYVLDSVIIQSSSNSIHRLLGQLGLKSIDDEDTFFTKNGTRFVMEPTCQDDPCLYGTDYWIDILMFRVQNLTQLTHLAHVCNTKVVTTTDYDYIEIIPDWTEKQLKFIFIYESKSSVPLNDLQDINMLGVDHIALAVKEGYSQNAKDWFESTMQFYESEAQETVITGNSGMQMMTLKSYMLLT
jgi:hypothetical protein